MVNYKQKELIYSSANLKLYTYMKPIILLSTNNGYFKTPTDTVLGPMIMG
jgi:hypothetical protein